MLHYLNQLPGLNLPYHFNLRFQIYELMLKGGD